MTANIICGARWHEWSCGRPISHDGDHADGAMFWPAQPKTVPLSQRMREAADAIAELNAMQGLATERGAVSPKYLREEADRMEREVQP